MVGAVLTMFRHAIRGRHEDRYVLREVYRRLRGARHSVLGNNVKDEAAARREAEDFLGTLRRLGLKRHHRCIEIGCGSLWAAEPVIEFLQPGRFLGFDVTDVFYGPARARLRPGLLEEKKPGFAVISPEVLASGSRFRPDLIFSRRTLVHVPPAELPIFLGQSCAMMAPATICVHETPDRPIKSYRFNKHSWVHSCRDVREALPPGFKLEFREGCYLVRSVVL
jgi:hypothetical protein